MASVDFPHAMVFADDKTALFEKAAKIAANCPVVYDFDLMQGGGHIKGYKIEGAVADELQALIGENEKSCTLPYAVGDGNHSLAAAKALNNSIKEDLGDDAISHPAR